MTYIVNGTETAVAIILAQALGGDIRWRGCQCGYLYGPAGDVIGGFFHKPGGYSISTVPYGGFAYRHEIEIGPCQFTCQQAFPATEYQSAGSHQ